MAEKKKITKAVESAPDNGSRTQRYPTRKGYAERIKKEIELNADDDAAETSGTDSQD